MFGYIWIAAKYELFRNFKWSQILLVVIFDKIIISLSDQNIVYLFLNRLKEW